MRSLNRLETCSLAPAKPLTSCYEILADNPKAQSGVYTVEIASVKQQVYCDMESNGGGWTLLLSHDASGGYFQQQATALSHGSVDASGPSSLYSMLGAVNAFKRDGKFEFRYNTLVAKGQAVNTWVTASQTSNPLDSSRAGGCAADWKVGRLCRRGVSERFSDSSFGAGAVVELRCRIVCQVVLWLDAWTLGLGCHQRSAPHTLRFPATFPTLCVFQATAPTGRMPLASTKFTLTGRSCAPTSMPPPCCVTCSACSDCARPCSHAHRSDTAAQHQLLLLQGAVLGALEWSSLPCNRCFVI